VQFPRVATRRPLASLLTACAVGAALAVSAASPAQAQVRLPASGAQVATLGDSYASGEGAPAPGATPWVTSAFGDSGADGCHRSVLSGHARFGALAVRRNAGRGGAGYVSAACSGATTVTLVQGFEGERSQLAAIGPRTRTVTLSIGGNDVGFSSVAAACNTVAPVPGAPSCATALAGSAAALQALTTAPAGGVTPLEQLYRAVRAKAPNARLLVTGYPLLFPTTATASPRCAVIQPAARQAVNAATLRLNAAAAAGAEGAGAVYVDLVQPFAGHSSCEADPAASWINTIVPQDVVASFHPNATGQRAIAGALVAADCWHRGR